jgi:hypothetical protein
VVDHQAGALGRQLDVELGEERDERVGGGDAGAEGYEEVALGIEEVDQEVGRQLGAEAWYGLVVSGVSWVVLLQHLWGGPGRGGDTLGLSRKEDDVVVGALAEVEQGQRLALGGLERELEAPACELGGFALAN